MEGRSTVDNNQDIGEVNLNIANATTGEKILYDITPIKKAERLGLSNTSLLGGSILSPDANVKKSSECNLTIYVNDGHMKSGKTVNFSDLMLDGKKLGETREQKQLTRKQWLGLVIDSDGAFGKQNNISTVF